MSEANSHGEHSADLLAAVQQKVSACMQCGTCSGSCANAFAMDLTPRQLWHLVQLGDRETIFRSKTFFVCSACYYCTLRCPRGLYLTEAMSDLKRLATAEGYKHYGQSAHFYRTFMRTVQRYGRVREAEFMSRYFMAVKNPIFSLGFTGLGLKFMRKRKIPLQIPRLFSRGRFDKLFRKVAEVEAKS